MSSTETHRLGQQRQFYLVMAGSGILLSLWQLIRNRPQIAMALFLAAVFFVVIEFVVPPLGRAFFKVWMAFAHFLGKINTLFLVSIVYFVIITPIGILRRPSVKASPYGKTECQKRKSSWFPLADDHRYRAPF